MMALLPLLLSTATTTATARTGLVCNTSTFPYVECQRACNGTAGPSCAGRSLLRRRRWQQQQPADNSLHHATSGSASAGGGCLNCSGTVCTMSIANDTAPPTTEPLGAAPAPGKRVVLTARGWEHTEAFHTLLVRPRRMRPWLSPCMLLSALLLSPWPRTAATGVESRGQQHQRESW